MAPNAVAPTRGGPQAEACRRGPTVPPPHHLHTVQRRQRGVLVGPHGDGALNVDQLLASGLPRPCHDTLLASRAAAWTAGIAAAALAAAAAAGRLLGGGDHVCHRR